MGKKRRRQRTDSAGALSVPKRPAAPPRIPSKHRDVLFGNPLESGTPRITLRDYDVSRPDGTRYPIPTRIASTRQVPPHLDGEEELQSDYINSLGHGDWTTAAKKYFYSIKSPEQIQEQQDRHDARYWWHNTYIVDRLIQHAQLPNALFTLDDLNLVLAYARGEDVTTGKPPFWIARKFKTINFHALSTYVYTTPRMEA